MIDNFALGLTHLLLGLAVWRLMTRRDLDEDCAGDDRVPGNLPGDDVAAESAPAKPGVASRPVLKRLADR